MNEQNWQNVKEIFLTALDKGDDSRAKFLDEICADNSALREEIESLLASHEEIEDFIEEPVFQVSDAFSTKSSAGEKEKRLGNYKIIREIGRGGMGTVYLAVRSDAQFNKRVAIKLLRRGMDSEDILKRFRNEERILAALEHPNISRLLDAGISDDNLPYFVMEYIEGESLDKYCDEHHLTTVERLELFRKICSAVHYAHQNLIVHRDLKPGNIIVTESGEPKLLDFGIAKLLNPELTSNTIAPTATFVRLMTPDYASPEQIRGKTITTASDIYSLGILLYRLLTGKLPYHFQDSSPQEIERVVCEEEPTKPSVAVSSLPAAVNGQLNSKFKIQNPKSLKGDLDNIVLMALRKEPSRRYKSVEQFAGDIERHLKGLPVSARRNTVKYLASKFIKRHKVGVLAASLILLSLIGGIVVSVWQAQIARREKAKAEAVNQFLQGILAYSDNSTGLALRDGRETTVRDVLNEASKRLETEDLSSQPEVKAELHQIIGASFLTQGNYEQAEKNLRAALTLQTQIYGDDSVETLPTLVELGQLFLYLADYQSAEKIYEGRLSILRREYQRGKIEPVYLLTALNDFAYLRRGQGNSKEAEALLREGLALKPQISPENRISVGISESFLALTLSDFGNFDESEKIVRARIADIRLQANSETMELTANLNGLGTYRMEKGALDEALQNFLESEKILRKLTNPYFLGLADNLRLQAQAFYLQGNFAEAEKKINEALEIYRKSSRPQYLNFPAALMIQGLIFNKTNRSPEAEKILREAVGLREQNLPPQHFMTALTKGALGECLTTQKKYAEAEPLLQESYETLKNSQGATNPRTLLAKSRLDALNELRIKN